MPTGMAVDVAVDGFYIVVIVIERMRVEAKISGVGPHEMNEQ